MSVMLECMNYDCNQVTKAIKSGLTSQEAAEEFDLDWQQNQYKEDWEFNFEHDMSMNG